jgi:uroporphyrinogen-III synthase
MAALIVRPGVEGQQLCSILQEHNIHALHLPLIDFEAASSTSIDTIEHFNQSDILIFVSKPSVQYTSSLLNDTQLKWPTTACDIFAIGQPTSHALAKLSKQKVYFPEISDSEHLLAMPQLQNISGKRVTIVRGDSGRELIYDSLLKLGAKVQYLEVYKRRIIKYDYSKKIEEWQQNRVSSIVVTSEQQLRLLVKNIPRKQLPWIQSLNLILPSNRIVYVANQLGFEYAFDSKGASNSALFPVIQRFETGNTHD